MGEDTNRHRILLSSAAKSRFPNNNASHFIIPFDNEQDFPGVWNVRLTHLSHSNCLYTFYHDVMTICESCTSASQCEEGCRVYIPKWPNNDHAREFIIQFLNQSCQNIMTIEVKRKTQFSYAVKAGWIVCLSERLRLALGYSANAMTSYDTHVGNDIKVKGEVTYEEKEYYVDIVPKERLVKEIVIKPKNADMIMKTLQAKFNFQMAENGQALAKLTCVSSGSKAERITIEKLHDDDFVLVCSEAFHKFLSHRTAAVHGKHKMHFLTHDQSNQFTETWTVGIYRKNMKPPNDSLTRTRVLEPYILRTVREVVDYLNKTINDQHIRFSATDDILTVSVGGQDILLTMDNTLRDILGLDENTFKSGTVTKGTAKVSLIRRINYFQFSTNITKPIHVGDTLAPILDMIPFNPKDCSVMSEREFKTENPILLKTDYVPHIEVGVYDDAGALVPFHKDAVTSLTVIFHKLS